MATTPNYSWIMPDPTDLVKDLPADFAIFGNAVDSTVKTNADAAIAKTIVDAKGDLIVGSAADTAARLAVGGTNGHVLTVNSGATNGVEWAAVASGGMTLLSTTTLSGATTTISGISQDYVNLYAIVTGMTGNTGNKELELIPNNNANLFNWAGIRSGISFSNSNVNTNVALTTFDDTTRTNADNAWAINIYNYSSSTRYKPITYTGFFVTGASTNATVHVGGVFRSNTAITSLVFQYGGNTFAGGTVLLYGVK